VAIALVRGGANVFDRQRPGHLNDPVRFFFTMSNGKVLSGDVSAALLRLAAVALGNPPESTEVISLQTGGASWQEVPTPKPITVLSSVEFSDPGISAPVADEAAHEEGGVASLRERMQCAPTKILITEVSSVENYEVPTSMTNEAVAGRQLEQQSPSGDPRRPARQAEEGAAQEEKTARLIEELAKGISESDGGSTPARPRKRQEAGNARALDGLMQGAPTLKLTTQKSSVETPRARADLPTDATESLPTDDGGFAQEDRSQTHQTREVRKTRARFL